MKSLKFCRPEFQGFDLFSSRALLNLLFVFEPVNTLRGRLQTSMILISILHVLFSFSNDKQTNSSDDHPSEVEWSVSMSEKEIDAIFALHNCNFPF